MKILVLNAGSSSQKSCLYQLSDDIPEHPPHPLWEASIDWSTATMKVKTPPSKCEINLESEDRRLGIAKMLDTLIQGETKVLNQLSEIDIVGHRVVHGGSEYTESVKINKEVKEAIARLIPLAPAHNPAHLEGIEAIEEILGDIAQVAVFDTAFHSGMPLESKVYPIPYEWYEKGVRRYGFHGISHKYCAYRAAQILGKPLESLLLITCHLGNGCSITAIKEGISINTTMGFTPLEGLMMGSRSGSIDPAILIYLMQEYNLNSEQLNTILNKESGLKGVSGISADLRAVLKAVEAGNERAILAVDMYIHRIKSAIGSMLGSLGGLDGLVFTAGVGENAPPLREKVCSAFEFIGIKLDKEKNILSNGDRDIASDEAKVRVLVVHTEEDWAIAQECWNLYKEEKHG